MSLSLPLACAALCVQGVPITAVSLCTVMAGKGAMARLHHPRGQCPTDCKCGFRQKKEQPRLKYFATLPNYGQTHKFPFGGSRELCHLVTPCTTPPDLIDPSPSLSPLPSPSPPSPSLLPLLCGAGEPYGYLQFIIDFWDNLPRVVIFSQDDCLARGCAWGSQMAFGRLGHSLRDWEQVWAVGRPLTATNCMCKFIRETNFRPRYFWYRWMSFTQANMYGQTPNNRSEVVTWPQDATFAIAGHAIKMQPRWMFEAMLRVVTVENACMGGTIMWAHALERYRRTILPPLTGLLRPSELSCSRTHALHLTALIASPAGCGSKCLTARCPSTSSRSTCRVSHRHLRSGTRQADHASSERGGGGHDPAYPRVYVYV